MKGRIQHKETWRRYRTALAITIVSSLAALPQAFGAPPEPVVERAIFTIHQGSAVALTIMGKNFGTLKPTVTIAGVPQTVADGNSDTFVRVTPPNLLEPHVGMYRVALTNNHNNLTTVFDVELDIDVTPGANFGTNTNGAKAANGAQCTLGQVILSAGPFTNGTPANGQLLLIANSLALFQLLGTTYGGDGVTTFALPDLRRVAPNGLTYSICDFGVFPAGR